MSQGVNLVGSVLEGVEQKTSSLPWRGVFALLGGFLIQVFVYLGDTDPFIDLSKLSLGSFYSFGNMMTYMTSYMRLVIGKFVSYIF